LRPFFAHLAVKVFCFAQEQEPLTAKFAKENRKVREEIQIESLPYKTTPRRLDAKPSIPLV
jgi:hypothetical protein